MPKITEKRVETQLAAYYRSQDCVVLRQAPFSRKRIDIVKKGKDDEQVVAIEIKLKDWQDGLRQARVNAIACDQSYLAIWHQHSAAALSNKKVFEDAGIGLVIIDATFVPRIEVESQGAAPSQVIRDYFCSNNLKLA
jgi:hypothetical protein